MSHHIILTCVACAVIALLGGCASKPSPAVPSASTAAEQTSAEQPPAEAAAIQTMSIERKRLLIAENFQPEVPLPMGEVVRGNAQSDFAWDYELIVPAAPAAVANWYREKYTQRDWRVVEESEPSPGAFTLTLMKNAAQTRVTITPEGTASARVAGILGVGAPVLQTQ